MSRLASLPAPLSLRLPGVFVLAAATQVLVLGARTLVDGVVGAAPVVDATLAAAGLLGVALGALLRIPPRLAASLVVAATLLLGFASQNVDVAAPLALLPPWLRAACAALLLAAVTAPLGSLIPALGRGAARAAYAADLLGAMVGVLAASACVATFGMPVVCAVVMVACGPFVVLLPPLVPEDSAPSQGPRPEWLAVAALSFAVGAVEVLVPRAVAPAVASAPWALPAAVAGAMVGGAFGARTAPRRISPLVGGSIMLALLAVGFAPLRNALLAMLVDTTRSVELRLVSGHFLLALGPAALAFFSARALSSVLATSSLRRAFALSAAAGAAGAFAGPALATLEPERATAGLAIALATLATVRSGGLVGGAALALAATSFFMVRAPDQAFAARDLSHALLQGDIAVPKTPAIFDERDMVGRVVVRADEDLSLYRDGKPDASALGDIETQALLGLLPLLYRPDAKTALVVGLGSGSTAAWLADAGVSVDVAEISPAVVRSVDAGLAPGSHALPDGIRIIHDDARAVLAAPPRDYDVITSEPTNLFVAGAPRMFTLEAMRAMRRATHDGVVVMWMHGYLASEALVNTIADTALTAFDAVDLFQATGSADVFFVGRPLGAAPRPEEFQARLGQRFPCAMAALGPTSLGTLMKRRALLARGDSPLHRDAQPVAVPMALTALLQNESIRRGSPPREEPPDALSSFAVINLLASSGGRDTLRVGARGLVLQPGPTEPPWAFSLARAGLAVLGDGVSTDATVEALRAMDTPRCASMEAWYVAGEVVKQTVRRDPARAAEVAAAVGAMTSRESAPVKRAISTLSSPPG